MVKYFHVHQKWLGFELRVTRLGYMQRGGSPFFFDRLLVTRLGAAATLKLAGASRRISWERGEVHKQKREWTMKAIYCNALIAFVFILLVFSGPIYASTTDDRIELAARESFVFRTFLKDDAIKIESKEGVVTLTGFVSEEPEKALAQETVAGLPGVKRVDNRLELKDELARKADALVSARVIIELLSHGNLSATDAYVHVRDGVVTVRGEVASRAQMDLITEYIMDVEGVKDVENEMVLIDDKMLPPTTASEKVGNMGRKIGEKAIDVGESIDDASITSLVKATLLYHRSTSAAITKVETEDGVVKLSGMAKNTSEKDLASKFVSGVYGVKKVVNDMTIEGDGI
jgi:hyperosmotically inducible periplasmic protein